MAYRQFSAVILPLLLISVSCLNSQTSLVDAQQLMEITLLEIPELPELPSFPQVELPPLPELPDLPELEVPQLPDLPDIPDLPDLPTLTLPAKSTIPKDINPFHSTNSP
ncbi:hypothetical protein P3X46_024713 [Hevea brasiliensis]|uniref:Uncharacterized protein n=1 Tax=Hevea brasiliensis TaxID=3981 RepID=A0ABQ9L4F2_HEVBR|nr:protein PELPK2-like [Hevea brasiliensis]KAJ9159191.1 hypothetical protein P3X46_024713 [Hevea brasiliensis]